MTDNLDDLLANIDDLDDFLREPPSEEEGVRPEDIEIALDSEELPQSREPEEELRGAGSGSPAETLSESAPPAPPVEPVAPSQPEPAAAPAGSQKYPVPGTRDWNTSPPYYLEIDEAVIEKEIQQLATIFYFVDVPVSEEDGSDTIKKALINYMRKPDRELADKYRVFLYQELLKELLEVNTIFLSKGEDEKELYYHIGAVTVFRILMEKFKLESRGYCYCYTGSGRGVRMFPEETIKSVVMDWYNENIFSSGLDFDNLTIYDRVKRKVNEQYREDRRRFHSLLEKVNLRAGKGRSLSPAKFLKMKGDDVIGSTKLQVYKRFVGGNLFL